MRVSGPGGEGNSRDDPPASAAADAPAAAPQRRKPLLRRLFGGTDEKAPRGAVRDARRAIGLCHALMSERGEVSGARLAREALAAWQSLGAEALAAFYDLLVDEFSPEPQALARAYDAYRSEPSQANLIRLEQAVEPPRQELFRRLNMAAGGTAVLVEMRRQVLAGLGRHAQWRGIEADLAHLLRSWFNRGFLALQRIDWRSSALVLEKLIEYEAVHEIAGWKDLRRRLAADRRCYAFFHPALPEEPLIFIEVALTRGISAKVQPLLDPDVPVLDPANADCATFYSITNCQRGLRGISFGNFLIKQVVEDLGRDLPRLKTFATLSPIPGFLPWLATRTEASEGLPFGTEIAALLARLEAPRWFEDGAVAGWLERRLAPLCAHYLLHAKQGDEPLDPVARFHLVNGARLEQLNWLGDTSPTGMRQSAGMMVNYRYRLGEVERNHEAYARERTVVASRRFRALAKEATEASGEA